MNEWLKKLFSQIKTVWSKGSTVQKVVITGIIIFVIGAIVFISVLSSSPSTVPLYNIPITDEDSRDRILIRLSEENIQATVNAAGIISVADEKTARKARTLLVREDLTPTNVSPWNLFDTERWTTTDFERNVNLLRSITNQVTQHIESLEEVDRANVVITRPERTLFAADQNPTTASVILYHRPGSDILTNKKKLQGIQKLLLFAVEGLKEENITITDSNGNVLNDFAGMAEIDRVDIIAREQKLISTLETQYRAKVLSALQQIFTPDRVRDLNIKIDMNMSKRFVDATEYSPITIRP
ncbi:MAG TPA: flagellar basal-body MS-ring/collar protein FliF, partial [Treponemataceae bacterium]|nr:flagellar basal-body MS-ring/collar protein FliF [Treponemataceae bacterium]